MAGVTRDIAGSGLIGSASTCNSGSGVVGQDRSLSCGLADLVLPTLSNLAKNLPAEQDPVFNLSIS